MIINIQRMITRRRSLVNTRSTSRLPRLRIRRTAVRAGLCSRHIGLHKRTPSRLRPLYRRRRITRNSRIFRLRHQRNQTRLIRALPMALGDNRYLINLPRSHNQIFRRSTLPIMVRHSHLRQFTSASSKRTNLSHNAFDNPIPNTHLLDQGAKIKSRLRYHTRGPTNITIRSRHPIRFNRFPRSN